MASKSSKSPKSPAAKKNPAPTGKQPPRQPRLTALQQEQLRKATMMRRSVIAGAIVLAVVVVAVFAGVFISANNQNQLKTTVTPPDVAADGLGIMMNPSAATASAPHKVAIYVDYQCSACQSLENSYGSALQSAAANGAISLEYRAITMLDASQNKNSSTRAAIGAACADVQGVYAAYTNQLFTNQPTEGGSGFTDEQLSTTFPTAAGLSGTKLTDFQQCYNQQLTGGFVKKVSDAGIQAVPGYDPNKVLETPTIVLDGSYATPTQLASVLTSLPAPTANATPAPTATPTK